MNYWLYGLFVYVVLTHSFKVHFLSITICVIIVILLFRITLAAHLRICTYWMKGKSLTPCPASATLYEKYSDILRQVNEFDSHNRDNYEKMKNMLLQANKVISLVGNTRDDIEIIKVDSDYVKIFRKDGMEKEENEFCFPGYIESIFRLDKIDFSVLDAVVEKNVRRA